MKFPIYKFWVYIGTTACVFLASCPLSQGHGHHFSEKSVPGVYIEEVPPPIFYDTFLPILLEYILPHWNRSDVTFNNWYNCTSETAPYRYTCPSVYHMNRAIMNLHIDFLALQPVTDSVPHTEYYNRLLTHSTFCNLIQRHFSGVYIQDDELGSYLQTLEKCNSGGMDDNTGLVILERMLPEFNFSIRHPFTKMESNFYNVFYKSINGVNGTVMDLVASATLSNARATIQGTLLSVYYAEKYRWAHAVQDCSSQIIPHSLLSSPKFNEKLDSISKHEKFRNYYDFSVPMSLISKYYSLPIADCTYTNETFVVRLQIPVIEKPKAAEHLQSPPFAPKLVTLIPAPFTYRKQVCNVQIDSRQRYLYDSLKRVAYKTQCNGNELCYTRDNFATRFIDICATAVLNQDFQQFVTQCKFQCSHPVHVSNSISEESEQQEEEGEVTRVGNDKYVVIGYRVKAVVKCQSEGGPSPTATGQSPSAGGDNREEAYEFPVEKDGALEVTLPCTCYMEVGGRRFNPSLTLGGCGVDLMIQTITPWHLLKEKDGNHGEADEGLIGVYTTDFSRRTDSPQSEASTASIQGGYSTAPLWIFFGLTSLILLIIQCYIIYLLSNNNGTNYSRHQLFFKARAPEPQVGLLETQYDNM